MPRRQGNGSPRAVGKSSYEAVAHDEKLGGYSLGTALHALGQPIRQSSGGFDPCDSPFHLLRACRACAHGAEARAGPLSKLLKNGSEPPVKPPVKRGGPGHSPQ